MPDPIRFNLATLGQLQAPANPGIGWVGPERPAESWADIAADPLSALFDVGRGAVTGDAPAGMNLQGLGALIAAAIPVAGGAKALRAATKAASLSNLAEDVRAIRAYHGSPDMLLDRISATPPTRQFPNAASELGAFFTIDPDEAARYADIARKGTGGRVYPADVPLKNPKEMTWGEFGKFSSVEPDKIAEAKALRKQLESAGHDGIIVRNTQGIPIEIASFKDVPLDQRVLPLKPSITAYHGSPHDFDQFSMSKIGTGEGAQAYGHGLYFAENPGVAAGYRDALSGTSVTPNLEIDPKAVERLGFKSDAQFGTVKQYITNAVREAKGDLPKAAQYLRNGAESQMSGAEHLGPEYVERAKKFSEQAQMAAEMIDSGAVALADNPGRMYEVQIHASPDHFLDWDKPLSEQSPHVQKAIGNIPDAPLVQKYVANNQRSYANPSGENLHDILEMSGRSRREIGEQLQQAGIPGIRYLDAGSRSAGEGSRNYVIFDEKLVSILKKYGVALPVIEGLREKAQKGGGVVPSSDVHSLVQQ